MNNKQQWIFSIHYNDIRRAVVGPAGVTMVEAALDLVDASDDARADVRGCEIVRDFVEGRLDPGRRGYYHDSYGGSYQNPKPGLSWCVCIGPVHEVMKETP